MQREITWAKIFTSLFSIFFLRIAFESYSNLTKEGTFMPVQSFLLHIPLSYFSIFLSLLFIIYFFTKENIKRIAIFLVFIHLYILIPPIIDYFINGSIKHGIAYLALDQKDLIKYYFKAMLPTGVTGITIGTHIAVYLLAISVAVFIFNKSKKIWKSICAMFVIYTAMFLYEIIPSLLILPTLIFSKSFQSPDSLYYDYLQSSWISSILKNYPKSSELGSEILMGQIFWILVLFQLYILFFIANKEKAKVFLLNLRFERILNYILIAFLGILISNNTTVSADFGNPVNIITLAVFVLMLILNASLAININDFEDIEIDSISNRSRPLVNEGLTKEEWLKLRLVNVFLLMAGILMLNRLTFFFILLTQSLYYIYSVPPLRLKRHFISSSILIGATTVSVAMSGFFLVSSSESIFSFPFVAILAIGISQALLSNLKDIKDFEGDSNADIKTIPVVFGLDKSKKIIGIIYFIVLILIPIYFKIQEALPAAFLCAVFATYLITKKQYREKQIFLVLFLYMATLLLFW